MHTRTHTHTYTRMYVCVLCMCVLMYTLETDGRWRRKNYIIKEYVGFHVCVCVCLCVFQRCSCECIYVYIRDVYERAEKEENTAMMCQTVCVCGCVCGCVCMCMRVCVVCVMCGCTHGSSFSGRSGNLRVSRAPVMSSSPTPSPVPFAECGRGITCRFADAICCAC